MPLPDAYPHLHPIRMRSQGWALQRVLGPLRVRPAEVQLRSGVVRLQQVTWRSPRPRWHMQQVALQLHPPIRRLHSVPGSLLPDAVRLHGSGSQVHGWRWQMRLTVIARPSVGGRGDLSGRRRNRVGACPAVLRRARAARPRSGGDGVAGAPSKIATSGLAPASHGPPRDDVWARQTVIARPTQAAVAISAVGDGSALVPPPAVLRRARVLRPRSGCNGETVPGWYHQRYPWARRHVRDRCGGPEKPDHQG